MSAAFTCYLCDHSSTRRCSEDCMFDSSPPCKYVLSPVTFSSLFSCAVTREAFCSACEGVCRHLFSLCRRLLFQQVLRLQILSNRLVCPLGLAVMTLDDFRVARVCFPGNLFVMDRARFDNLPLGPDSLRYWTLGSDRLVFLLFVCDSIPEFIEIR